MASEAAAAGQSNVAEQNLLKMKCWPNWRDGAQELRQRVEETGKVHHHLIKDIDKSRRAAVLVRTPMKSPMAQNGSSTRFIQRWPIAQE